MHAESIYIVYNEKFLGIFSNSNLAKKKVYQIKGEFESYSSPALMYYRLLELYKEHKKWEDKLVVMNSLVDMVPQEKEEPMEYVWRGHKDIKGELFLNSNFYMEGNRNEFIKC